MINKLKGCKRSKMMWWSLVLIILGALADTLPYIQEQIDPKYYGLILMAIGLVTAVLRWATTKPLEDM